MNLFIDQIFCPVVGAQTLKVLTFSAGVWPILAFFADFMNLFID